METLECGGTAAAAGLVAVPAGRLQRLGSFEALRWLRATGYFWDAHGTLDAACTMGTCT